MEVRHTLINSRRICSDILSEIGTLPSVVSIKTAGTWKKTEPRGRWGGEIATGGLLLLQHEDWCLWRQRKELKSST